MDIQAFQKFCPVCKLGNDANATICRYCKTSLTKHLTESVTTRLVEDTFELTEEIREQVISSHPTPSVGLSLFLLNEGESIALSMERELVLGRNEHLTSEPIVDLTKFEAFELGVSRRHAMIKVVEDKYELTDLNSSNGTRLNGERLVPNKPRALPSGSVIQLGQMKLIVIYLAAPSLKEG